MWLNEKQFRIRLGGNTYVDVPDLVVYKGKTLFTLKRHDGNGELGIYFEIYNSSGQHVASVRRNQIYQPDRQKESYRVDGSADECSLADMDTGDTLCRVRRIRGIQASPIELEVWVHLYTPDGFLFDATPTSTNLRGLVMTGNVFVNCSTGITITEQRVSIG